MQTERDTCDQGREPDADITLGTRKCGIGREGAAESDGGEAGPGGERESGVAQWYFKIRDQAECSTTYQQGRIQLVRK